MPRVVMDDSIYFRNWKKSTDRLRDHLVRKLNSIQTRADAKRKEADEIEKEKEGLESQIAELDRILPKPKPKIVGDNGQWAPGYDFCRHCKRDTIQHMSRGLCSTCYSNTAIRNSYSILDRNVLDINALQS